MPILFNVLVSLAISFSVVYLTIPGIIKVARARKLFDIPNTRSATKQVVPTLGGIAIFAGFMLSVILSTDNFRIDELKYLFASVTIMFMTGLKDDILDFSARRKLVIEVLTAFYLVILGNFRFTDLHGIFGINQIDYFSSVLLSVFAIVGIVNALNLIDGIDGLASGIGILISVVYGTWFLNSGDYVYALTCFSLTGSLGAFFLYNVFGTANKIFMGDTGSLILGTIVAVLTIHFNEFLPISSVSPHGLPAISLAIIMVPVVDTIRVFTIRLIARKSPFSPDMNHLHHHLLRLTKSHLNSSLIVIAVNGILVFIALNLIGLLDNNTLFFMLLFSGLILAEIPAWILRWNEKKSSVFAESKSNLELFTSEKKAG
jgi:UDP-GlcNAc:undecaprenyl-phosphate/decaprenyl-phosphate GlcNAc-1-phosphate transferase